jgi:histidyl-tRNA synthetase
MKVATHGPVFRYERPQKGRFRQFHQLDAEIIGTDSPLADVELLTMADQLLHELGIADGVTLQLNTLGDAETREAWRAALVAISRRIGRPVRRQPGPPREEPAPHPRQQGPARPPAADRRAQHR